MALEDQYDPIFEEAGREWNVHPTILKAVMQQETGGNRTKNGKPITSSAGAGGLMQIMPDTATHLGMTDVHDPKQAIFGAAKYLRENLDDPRFGGTMENALGAYNAGPEKYAAYLAGRAPLPAETRAYIPAVASHFDMFSKAQAAPNKTPGGMTADDILNRYSNPASPEAAPAKGGISADDILKAYQSPEGSKLTVTPTQTTVKPSQGLTPAQLSEGEGANPYDTGANTIPSTAGAELARGFGPVTPDNPIGFSPQQEQALRAAGIYAPQPGTGTPVQRLNEALINPLAFAGGLATRSLGALAHAAQANVAESFANTGNYPRVPGGLGNFSLLGRDIAALPEAFPAGLPEGGAALRGIPSENPLVARPMARAYPLAADTAPGGLVRNPLISEAPVNPLVSTAQPILPAPAELPPGTTVPLLPRINALIAEDNRVAANQPAQIPPTGAVVRNPLTGEAAPVVQPPNPLSSGAATIPPGATPNPLSTARLETEQPTVPAPATPIPTGLTPAQIEEFKNIPESLPAQTKPIRTQADAEARADEIVNHFASIGNREPIPGAVGSLPTVTGNSGLATLYRAVRDSDTPVPFTTLEQAGKQRAAETVSALVKDPTDLADAIAERGNEGAINRDTVFAGKKPGDVTPAVSEIDKIMASPARFNPVVQSELPKFRAMLMGEDGNTPVTDAEDMYGIDKAMRYKISSLAQGTKDDARAAKPQILQVLGALRSQIESAAPGFDNYMSKFSDRSRAIDEMTYLQGRKLVDPDNQQNPISLQNVKSTLADIAKQQRSPRITTADSVTPETIAALQTVRDQLQREADTQSLGKALGSNTFQNAATSGTVGRFAGHAGNALVSGGIGAGIGYLTGEGGVLGATAGMGLGAAAKTLMETRAAKAAAAQDAGRAMLMKALRDRMLNIDNKGVNALKPPQSP